MSFKLPYQQVPTQFTKFELTPEEYKEGCTLTSANIAVISNLQASVAEEKNNLEFTPNDVLSYTQQEAFKAGQLSILSHLLQEAELTMMATEPTTDI